MNTSVPPLGASEAPAKPSYPLVTALAAIRKSKQITQAELAQRAGLARMTIQRLESNGLDPRLSTLQDMAKVLEQELVVIPAHLSEDFALWLAEHNVRA